MTNHSGRILRTADFERSGLGSRSLRRDAELGRLTRVVRGSYARTDLWESLDPREQYVTRVVAVVERLSQPVAASHWSAAAIWGFPVPDAWPADVQVIDTRRQTSNMIKTLHRRPGTLLPGDVSSYETISVTSAGRTATDIALISSFTVAVLLFDHGLRLGLFTVEAIVEQLERRPNARRRKSAIAALNFASPLAEWPGESFSRAAMSLTGISMPELQKPFFDRWGKIGEVDFYWPETRTVGEFDGLWKYTDPRFMNGLTAAEVVKREKRRGTRLESHPEVDRVVRWDYSVARSPEKLASLLIGSGVKRSHPRLRTSQHA